MSGYYNRSYNKYQQKTRYKPRRYEKPERGYNPEEPEKKEEEVQVDSLKTRDQGIQISMGEGIPCRLVPVNPEDYPRLLALLNINQNPPSYP